MDQINIEVNIPGVDESITSVKELRARISELKDSLVTLEAGTEEYNTVVKELQASTSKLNEVNAAAKQSADALPGSYNAINNQMKELIQEYKNMAIVTDEDRQKQEELGKKINELNDELKRQDAAIGNYQRNVGNYKEAFEGLRQVMDIAHTGAEQLGDGFSAVGSIIQSTTGNTSSASSAFDALGSTFEGLTGVAYSLYDSIDKVNIAYQLGGEVLSLFKTKQVAATTATVADSAAKKANTAATVAETTATNAATVATKGLTKALLTNPFTIIAVAVLALVANLDTLTKAFNSVVDWITGANEKLEQETITTNKVIDANDRLIKSQDERSKQFEREIRMMKLNGASASEVIKARMKENLANRQALKGQMALTEARIADLKVQAAEDPDKYNNILQAAQKSYNELIKSYRKLWEANEDLKVSLLETQKQEKEAALSAAKSKVKANADAAKKIREEQAKTVDELKKSYEQDVQNFIKSINEKIKANQQLLFSYDEALKYIQKVDKIDNQTYNRILGTNKDITKEIDNQSTVYKAVYALRLREAKRISDEIANLFLQETDALEKRYNEEQKSIINNSKLSEKARKEQLKASEDSYKKALGELRTNLHKFREESIGKDNLSILDQTIVGADGSESSTISIMQQAEDTMKSYRNALDKVNEAYKIGGISEQDYIKELNKMKKVLTSDIANLNINGYKSPLKEALLSITKLTSDDEQEMSDNLNAARQKIMDILKADLNDVEGQPKEKELNKNSLVLQAFGLSSPGDIDNQYDTIISKLTENKKKLEDFKNSEDFKLLNPDQQAEIIQQLMDTEAKIIEEKNKQTEDNAKKTVDTIKSIYSGAMSGLNVLGDLFQAKMNLAKTKADKIKKDTNLTAEEQEKLLAEQQKEYDKAFEANKKIQIAQTTISTLASAMEAYKSMAGIPVVGPALGAAAAAAALATGYLQIKQIKATTPESLADSSSSGSSPTTNTIDVNSLLNQDRESQDLNNDYLTELQGQKNSRQKVYVLQSEIDETHDKMKTQVQQSTF